VVVNSSIEKKAYQVVVNANILPKASVDRVYQEAETSDQTFSRLLVREGHIKEEELLQIYSKNLGIPFIRLRNYKVDKSLIEKIPVKFTYYYRFFPMILQNRKLTIAVSRLIDIRVLDEMRFGLGYEIELNLAPENDVEDMLKSYYGVGSETIDRLLAQSSGEVAGKHHEEKEDVQDIEKLAETASIVQLVNQIILEAYKKRASDIHFEPFQGRVRLRYRIDGVLREAPVPPEINQFFNAILSRIKIMANLNIVERRLPQDGKARVKVQQEMIDLRVSSIPTPYGESMVVRILPNQKFLTLHELGFESDQLTIFHELLQRPNGIIFVTGPTGSGKSTTLNAALNVLNHPDRKIITIEDPVEYDIPGVTQINVQPEIGLTFAMGLRSVLRHDPDIMMVGEVRDFETADTAIRVALTGHLILSTLHTNDAASGVTRLLDIGVEPFLIASSVIAFTAQRLVRSICKHCKEEDPAILPEVRDMIYRDLRMAGGDEIRIFRGRGCEACNQTGFQGRMVIQEILVADSSLRELIINRASAETIKRHACSSGMITLRQDGWKKVIKGLTVPEEIIRVTPGDETGDWSTAQGFAAVKPVSADPGKAPQAWVEFKETGDNFTERRKYVRISVQFRIIFRVIDMEEARKSFSPDTFILDGTTQDISAGGVCFCTEAKVSPDDILEIKIGLPDDAPVIQCIGRVLRVSYTESGSEAGKALWRIAVSFLAIHSEDRKRIELYCQKSASL
jgi:type II secretory ATPase GspE/PulE/Tfp pilus assembly ATPase PilB-like protein